MTSRLFDCDNSGGSSVAVGHFQREGNQFGLRGPGYPIDEPGPRRSRSRR